MTPTDTLQWNSLQWRRRLERFGEDDGPVVAAGPGGEVDGVWYVSSRQFPASLKAGGNGLKIVTGRS